MDAVVCLLSQSRRQAVRGMRHPTKASTLIHRKRRTRRPNCHHESDEEPGETSSDKSLAVHPVQLSPSNRAAHQKTRVKDTNRHWARVGDTRGIEGGQESPVAAHRCPFGKERSRRQHVGNAATMPEARGRHLSMPHRLAPFLLPTAKPPLPCLHQQRLELSSGICLCGMEKCANAPATIPGRRGGVSATAPEPRRHHGGTRPRPHGLIPGGIAASAFNTSRDSSQARGSARVLWVRGRHAARQFPPEPPAFLQRRA